MNEHAAKLAAIAAPSGWLVWFLAHLEELNAIAKLVLIVLTCFATLAGGLYHWRKWRELGREKKKWLT